MGGTLVQYFLRTSTEHFEDGILSKIHSIGFLWNTDVFQLKASISDIILYIQKDTIHTIQWIIAQASPS